MMYNHYGWGGYASNMGPFIGGHEWLLPLLLLAAPLIIIAALWSLFWKGLALWHAAQRGQYWWFLILLVVNTLGILEIIYLFFVAKLHFNHLFSSDAHDHSHRSHHS
jgi:hypothetical protein